MRLNRAEAVERLRELLEQVKRGTVTIGNRTIQIPDEVRLEVHAERDELEFELDWRASP